MRFDENADLDTSNVEDLRGGGGGGGGMGGRVAIGGGGVSIVGLIIYFLLSQLGGGSGSFALPDAGSFGSQNSVSDSGQLAQSCQTGKDANSNLACEAVGVINSLDGFWTDTFARSNRQFQPAHTRFFSGSVDTGCGGATSDTGPFYCPADNYIYIDLSFYQELEQRFGAEGGPFARAYVLAHEYGHHIQALLGTTDRVQAGDTGPTSGSVRLELQADCYAGAWGKHASTVPTRSGKPLILDVNQQDLAAAIDTAGKIGDDYIQSHLAGRRVDQSQFTHGSSAQRTKWYRTGFDTGSPANCDTFARNVNLG